MGTLTNSENPDEMQHKMLHFIRICTFYNLKIKLIFSSHLVERLQDTLGHLNLPENARKVSIK